MIKQIGLIRNLTYRIFIINQRNLFQKNPQYDIENMKTTYYMRTHVDEYIQSIRKKFEGVTQMENLKEIASSVEPSPMTRSQCQFKIPLKDHELVRRMYTSTGTKLRIGKILEDLDMFAVYLTYLHADGNTFKCKELHNELTIPRVVVTAAIGQLTINKLLNKNDEDLIFDGFVSYVGKTSAQTVVRMYQKNENTMEKLMECKVIMVSKNYLNMNETLPLPQMKNESEEEKKLFEEGEKYVSKLKRSMNANVLKGSKINMDTLGGCNEIIDIVDRVNKDTFNLKDLAKDETTINAVSKSNSFIAYAQSKNYHGTVFGGLIMRKGIELASITVHKFCEDQSHLVSIGNIAFRQPVAIGSIIDLSAIISYVDPPFIQVRVYYEISSVSKSFENFTSNIMHCTFKYNGDKPIKKLYPEQLNDILIMMDGKEHIVEAKKALGIIGDETTISNNDDNDIHET